MSTSAVSTEIDRRGDEAHLVVTLGDYTCRLPFKHLGGKDVAFLDISGQFRLIEAAADAIVEKLRDENVTFDTILNPVSKSNALAHAIAARWGQDHPELTRTAVARKGTGHGHQVHTTYRSVTTPKDQTLSLTDDDAAAMEGKKVIIVDDVIGAGGTFRALEDLVAQAGGEVVHRIVMAVEEGAPVSEHTTYLFTLPVLDD